MGSRGEEEPSWNGNSENGNVSLTRLNGLFDSLSDFNLGLTQLSNRFISAKNSVELHRKRGRTYRSLPSVLQEKSDQGPSGREPMDQDSQNTPSLSVNWGDLHSSHALPILSKTNSTPSNQNLPERLLDSSSNENNSFHHSQVQLAVLLSPTHTAGCLVDKSNMDIDMVHQGTKFDEMTEAAEPKPMEVNFKGSTTIIPNQTYLFGDRPTDPPDMPQTPVLRNGTINSSQCDAEDDLDFENPVMVLKCRDELPVPDPSYVASIVSQSMQRLIAKTYKKDCRTWLWKSKTQREARLKKQEEDEANRLMSGYEVNSSNHEHEMNTDDSVLVNEFQSLDFYS